MIPNYSACRYKMSHGHDSCRHSVSSQRHCSRRIRLSTLRLPTVRRCHRLGEGAQSFLNSDGTAQRRAEEDAQKDIQRTLRRARCPRCHERNPGAVWSFLFPWLIMAALFMGGAIFIGYAPTWFDIAMSGHDRNICRWLLPLIMGAVLLIFIPFTVWRKWTTTDIRVQWVDDKR